ncbi:MAG: endonuclease V, partial [Saccharolobus sp.]
MVEKHLLEFLEKLQLLFAKNLIISHFNISRAKKICGVDVAYNGNIG